nr:hypothetical protein [Tanacetum cinerariifolium]
GFRKSKQDLNNGCCGSILRNPKRGSGATCCSYEEFEVAMKLGTEWRSASLGVEKSLSANKQYSKPKDII